MQIKVAKSTMEFLKSINHHPGCTGRQIHEYLFDTLYPGNTGARYKTKVVERYNPNTGYAWTAVQTKSLNWKFSYLTSPYYSNMLVDGKRTKSRAWVRRIKCSKDNVFRYFLTPKGLGALKSICAYYPAGTRPGNPAKYKLAGG